MDNSFQEITLTVQEISYHSLAQIQRILSASLTPSDNACIRESQKTCTEELKSTNQNCELRLFLQNYTAVLKAGACENIVQAWMENNEFQWKFCQRTWKKFFYDVGQGAWSLVKRLLNAAVSLLPIVDSTYKGITSGQ